MGIAELIPLIAQTGGLLGLAIFAIFMLNKVWCERLEEAKKNAAEIAEQRRELLDALHRNTEVMTRLCERLEK
jgi:uncharacterized membrane protein